MSMRKKIILLFLVIMLLGITALTGCAANTPPAGLLFTRVKAPDAVSTLGVRTGVNLDRVSSYKNGEATCVAILGLVSVGDCSIQAAMGNGEIDKIHHVDYRTTSILGGIFHSLTTIVHGE